MTDDTTNWVNILLDQFKLVEDCGLMGEVQKIYITVIIKDYDQLDIFNKIISTYNKIEISSTYWRDDLFPTYESVAISKMWNHAQHEDAYFLYLHAKGVSALPKLLDTKNIDEYKCYLYWRKFLEWGVLENWKKCIEAINDGYDNAGVNFSTWPTPHYSGTMFWTKSEYLKKLDDIETDDWWNNLRIKQNIINIVSNWIAPLWAILYL